MFNSWDCCEDVFWCDDDFCHFVRPRPLPNVTLSLRASQSWQDARASRGKMLSLSKTDTTLSDTDGSQQLLRMNRNLMRDNSRKDAIVEIYLCWHWWRARLSWAVTNVLCFIINELITSLLHNASTKTIIYDTIWFSWQNLHEIWFFQAPATHDYYPIFRTQSGGSCSVSTGRNCHYGTRAQQGWFQISEFFHRKILWWYNASRHNMR